ncbi:MAG: glycosyltransferase family 39 protein [Flavobacteriales bacterium]|nr:glycosyltransferase family 39 protein [Flavobacteriales bacterium]
MINRPSRELSLLLLLWALATALDFGKAFHIDDTFHLLAAQWIEHHPLSPMSGLVNWGQDPQPLHDFNQPPGYFYIIALTGHFLGYSEGVMHGLRAMFSLIAIANLYQLARHLVKGQALFITSLLVLCPAFLVNQGLMTDVPLLAMHLLGFRLLLVPGSGHKGVRYLWAALAFSAGVFIKYTTLPVLLVFPLVLALRREGKYIALAAVPFVLLVLWGLWNVQEFGAVHLFGREGGDRSLRGIFVRTLGMFTALGAVSPFVPAMAMGRFPAWQKWIRNAWLAALSAFVILAAAVYSGNLSEAVSDEILRIAFTFNGVLFVALATLTIPWKDHPTQPDRWALILWAGGLAAFLAFFAPMMATRHILLLLAPLLLILGPALGCAGAKARSLALATTAVLGVLLTLSDREYAGFYRDMAPRIAQEMGGDGTIWSAGHWGWQWYTAQAGMRTYEQHGAQPVPGDVVVMPEEYDAQAIAGTVQAVLLRSYEAPPTASTFFNVEQFAGMYTSSYGKLPWSLSRSHIKTIRVYRVVASGGSAIVQEPFGK